MAKIPVPTEITDHSMTRIESLPADTELLIVLDLKKDEMYACQLASLLAKSAFTTDTPESPDVPLARKGEEVREAAWFDYLAFVLGGKPGSCARKSMDRR